MQMTAAKKGSILEVTLTGTAAQIAEARAMHTAQMRVSEDGTSAVTRANRAEYAALDRLVDRLNAQASRAAAPAPSAAAASRRIELLAVAERDGLPHGKSWICSAQQVERGDADPWMEGEFVCYVYGQ